MNVEEYVEGKIKRYRTNVELTFFVKCVWNDQNIESSLLKIKWLVDLSECSPLSFIYMFTVMSLLWIRDHWCMKIISGGGVLWRWPLLLAIMVVRWRRWVVEYEFIKVGTRVEDSEGMSGMEVTISLLILYVILYITLIDKVGERPCQFHFTLIFLIFTNLVLKLNFNVFTNLTLNSDLQSF